MPNPIAGSLATGQNRIMGVFGLGLVERRVRYVDADTLSGVRPRRAPRGPIAALMLELLDRLGFDDATAAAEDRLLGVLLRDGELHELFDARNGAVLGQREQGWTSALYLWLLRRRRHPARRHAHRHRA